MNVFYFYLLLLAHPYLAMWWKSFELAGRQKWEALIPGYNYFIVFKLGSNKPLWSLLLIFPGVHIVMWSVANLSYIRRFGYFSFVDTLQGIFFPYVILYKIATSGDKMLPETNWANSAEVGNREWGDHLALFLSLPVIGHVIALGFAAVSRPKPGKKTKVKEWGDSIWFALVAALVIRTYVFEPFKIPTGSMENTLLVGDFLFVNKLAYGPKVPVTPVSYPLVHNTVPWVNVKSYVGLETSGYTRVWGYSKVQRNDVVVFNYPAGDTAIYDPRMPEGLMGHNYHDKLNEEALYLWWTSTNYFGQVQQEIVKGMSNEEKIKLGQQNLNELTYDSMLVKYGHLYLKNIDLWKNRARVMFANGETDHNGELIKHGGLIYRPVDKRENYIKRCVGLPGDYLELKNSILYVNGHPAHVAENQNLRYNVEGFIPKSSEVMAESFGVYPFQYLRYTDPTTKMATGPIYAVLVNKQSIAKLKKGFPNATFEKVMREVQYSDNKDAKPTSKDLIGNLKYFPNDININNTVSDVHRFWVPKKGVTVTLTKENIPYYRRIISVYEGHTLVEKNGKFIIDGKQTTKYTFGMNYYWMMGDNRFNSADSRMWGFVPEDHIVGKASMVWFSSGYDGIRWDRLFKSIK